MQEGPSSTRPGRAPRTSSGRMRSRTAVTAVSQLSGARARMDHGTCDQCIRCPWAAEGWRGGPRHRSRRSLPASAPRSGAQDRFRRSAAPRTTGDGTARLALQTRDSRNEGTSMSYPIRTVARACHVETHVRRAIAQRLGCSSGAEIVSVARDEAAPHTVIVHLNSGGNAHAAAVELRRRGYRVDPTGYDPFASGHYGVQLRVGPWRAPEEAPPRQQCSHGHPKTN